MVKSMNSSIQVKDALNRMRGKCDDIKHEKMLIVNEFESLQNTVKKCGIICGICFVIQVLISLVFLRSRDPSIFALGRFLTPLNLAIFLGALYIVLTKGFDMFINLDTKYSKKLADRLNKVTVTEKVDELNDAIMRLEFEMQKMEEKIYENVEVPDQAGRVKTAAAGEETTENDSDEWEIEFFDGFEDQKNRQGKGKSHETSRNSRIQDLLDGLDEL